MTNLFLNILFLISIQGQSPEPCSSDVYNEDEMKCYVMQPIIVTAKRWKWVLDTRPISGEIIKIKEVERTSDLGGIIKSMLNADIISYGGEGSSQILSLRGASPDQTLFFIDGVQINTAQGSGLDMSQWPVSWIDRIEIYRAGSSVEMGAQAIGGIVNIITKKEKVAHRYISSRIGSFGNFNVNTLWSSNYLNGKLQSWLGVQSKQGKGDFWYLDENHDAVRQRENADYKDISAMTKVGYSFGNNKLELNLRMQNCDRGSPGSSEFPTPEARLKDQMYSIQAKLTYNKGVLLQSVCKTYTNWFNRGYKNPHPIIYADDMHKNFAMAIEEKCLLFFSPNFKAIFGVEIRKDKLVSSTDGECERQKFGTFLQNEILLMSESGRYLLLLPGIRSEWVDEYQSEICPGMGVVYTFLGGFIILKASTEKVFRPPTFDDLFWPASAMAVGNPDLLPEEGRNSDLGVILYPLSSIIRTTFTGFHRDVTNLINWIPGAKGIWRPHNVGKAKIMGIEAELSSYFYPLCNIYLEIVSNYAYTVAKDLTGERNSTGKQISGRPVHKANLKVYISFEKYQMSTTWNYVGLRYTTASNTKWIPEYIVGDFIILYQLNGNIDLSIGIKNITGKRYIDAVNYPVPGRRFSVSMSLDF